MFNDPMRFDPMQDALKRKLGAPIPSPLGAASPANTPTVGTPQPGVSTTMPPSAPAASGGGSGSRQVAPRGSAPAGWDERNWNDPSMQSVKYRAGRLLQGVTRPSDVAARVRSAEFQAAFPGATFDGKDRINFGGALSDGDSGTPVYDIDVLMGADRDADSSNGLWWGHDVPGMATGPGGAVSGTGVLGGGGMALPGQQSDLMAQILATLQEQTAIDPQALLQQQLR